jgi:ADP-ribosylation factor GTPase-activating protein 1
MDAWKEDQVKKMMLGGNQKFIDFCSSQPEFYQGMSIKDKYNSHFASQYREKLSCEVEGRTWTPSKKPANHHGHHSHTKPASREQSRDTNGGNGWDSWDTAPKPTISKQDRQRNEDYFARMGASNSSKRDDIAPSKGGKYGGFGNPNFPSQQPTEDDLMGNLSKGWNVFSSVATQYLEQGAKVAAAGVKLAAEKMDENVLRPASAAIRDGNAVSIV